MAVRLVCKGWREGVQKFMMSEENRVEPSYDSTDYKSLLKPNTLCLTYRNGLKNYAKVGMVARVRNDRKSRLEPLLSGITKEDNPFPNGAAIFSSVPETNPRTMEPTQFWNKVDGALLKMHGKRLHSASFSIEQELENYTTQTAYQAEKKVVEEIRKYLKKMPNLETLHLGIDVKGSVRDDDGGKPKPMPRVKLPLAPLPNLKRLSVNFNFGPLTVMPTKEHFERLTSLSLPAEQTFMDIYDPEKHSSFPHLQHLNVSVWSIQGLLKLKMITGPLREVDVIGHYIKSQITKNSEVFGNVCPIVFFYLLQNSQNTLNVLRVNQIFSHETYRITLGDLRSPLKLKSIPKTFNFPQLKILSLNIAPWGTDKCVKDYGSVDSILALQVPPPFLEIVIGSYGSSKAGECFKKSYSVSGREEPTFSVHKGPEIEVHSCYRRMYVSNIWEMVPKLEEIYMPRWKTDGINAYWRDLQDESCHFTRRRYNQRR